MDLPILLVVEDEPLLLMDMEDLLKEAGFDVLGASSGDTAIGILRTRTTPVRGLITDIRLGGITGWDVARQARELVADLPVVYVSGGNVAEWTSQGVPNSVMIPKPFAIAQVITAISQLMNRPSAPTA